MVVVVAGVGGQLGFGTAIDYALELGPSAAVQARIVAIGAQLREQANAIDGVISADLSGLPGSGSGGVGLGGICTFNVEGLGGAVKVWEACAAAGIAVSVTAPSSTLLDATRRQLPSLLRVSPHYFNNQKDLDAILQVFDDHV